MRVCSSHVTPHVIEVTFVSQCPPALLTKVWSDTVLCDTMQDTTNIQKCRCNHTISLVKIHVYKMRWQQISERGKMGKYSRYLLMHYYNQIRFSEDKVQSHCPIKKVIFERILSLVTICK